MMTSQEIDGTLQDIRRQCRLAMNGIASSSMRQHGLEYKLNFGVPVQKIKDISTKYIPDAGLAERLWAENTRELKILATLLFPIGMFTRDIADRWLADIKNQEIREQICRNLYCDLPYASALVGEWGNSDLTNYRTTAYWLLASLLIADASFLFNFKELKNLITDASDTDMSLRNAALLALKRLGRSNKDIASYILQMTENLKESGNPLEREVYDSLSFEFEFYR
ncbi:hypothetical protein M2132_001657 [Dysgonomonas sp. PH5-45]|uniref:DNA alkylation repair protein n=1 Tax=unclassified Dysgonomonas TaxID=2630389 RepID=UPI0024767CF3|nr:MULTISPECIES: DNA alkylation repair protein [unclassified Dysgonomonas]MDH6355316.1 hypothetical protein [Dysgonomonas sp. PH5-45]MDH6388214.1 hypothetical protein [Dysgonomonas sp. PH5-37]